MDFDTSFKTLASEIKNTQASVDEATNLLLTDLVTQISSAKSSGTVDQLISSVQTSKRELVNAVAQVASRQYDTANSARSPAR